MNLKAFLENNEGKKKIIITDDVQNVNNLIFRLCEKDDKKISNANVVTILDVAKEIVLDYIFSNDNANISDFNYINRESAVSIVGKILNSLKEKLTFVHEDSFCTATYREIYDNINLIRLNGKEEIVSNDKQKLKEDLDLLIASYDSELKNDNYYDDARILIKAKECGIDNSNENVVYGILDFNHSFSMVEIDLINHLVNNNNNFIEIDKNKKIKNVVFKECYSYFDEVNEVLVDLGKKDILETLILYTDDIYYPYIKSIFGRAGIETSFTTGFKATNVNYIKDIKYLLNFAINDYYYKDLKPLCLDELIRLDKETKEESKEESNNNNSNNNSNNNNSDNEESNKDDSKYLSLIKQFEKGINLGISCKLKAYSDFINCENYDDFIKKRNLIDKTDKNDENVENEGKRIISKEFFVFMKNIVQIFTKYNERKDLSALVLELMGFIDEYKVKINKDLNEHNQTIKSKLFEMSESLKLMDSFKDSREGLIYLDNLLDALIVSDAYESGSLEVRKINKAKVFNKKNIYILGLTSKQYLGNNPESPVLSVECRKELCEYQYEKQKYNLQLLSDEENMKKEYIFDTCDYLLEDSNLNVFCSKYDQIENYPLSKAPIFNQLMEKYKIKKLSDTKYSYPIFTEEYTFDAKEEMMQIEKEVKGIVEERKKKKEEKVKKKENKSDGNDDSNKENINNKNILVFSKSSLDEFIKCEVKYYYNHILHLSSEDYAELEHDKWLSTLKRGSLVHDILQKYVEEVFQTTRDDAKQKKYGEKINETIFEEKCNEVFEEYDIIQASSDKIKENEKKDIKGKLNDYLNRMHEEFSDPKNEWYVESCEVNFGPEFDSDGNIKKEDEDKSLCFQEFENKERIYFRGRIDRIDRSKNDDNKIRIVDYKTGNTKTFIEKVINDRQHHIYAWYEKNKDKEKDNEKEKDVKVEFRYEFIDYKDYPDNVDGKGKEIKMYEIKNEDLNEPIDVKTYKEIISFMNGEKKLSNIKYIKKNCEYCKYKDICVLILNQNKEIKSNEDKKKDASNKEEKVKNTVSKNTKKTNSNDANNDTKSTPKKGKTKKTNIVNDKSDKNQVTKKTKKTTKDNKK